VNGAEVKSAPEGLEGVASKFLSTLGLLDLILGSIAMYCIRLWRGPSITYLFPSTGQQWFDLALLASAAALIGKMISLIVFMGMAILNIIIKRSNFLGYYANLQSATSDYCTATQRSAPAADTNPLELAVACLTVDTPANAEALERIRTTAIFSYGAAILAVFFAIYLRSSREAGGLTLLSYGCVIGFLLLGIFQQLDYIKTATVSLKARKSE
jgi:hypothetical protein